MRWRALAVLVVAAGCGRSSLMGNGGRADLAPPADLGCAGAACDLGDGGDPCADPAACARPACVGDPRCHAPGAEVCNNGLDDDDDGRVDCADPDCAGFPGCQPHPCDPQHPDCTDPMCAGAPACQDLKCHPSVDFGTLQAAGSSVTRAEDTTGTRDVAVTPCAPGGGGMVVGEFTLAAVADVTLAWQQGKGEDHVFGLFRAGVNQACGDNPVTCVDPKEAPTGRHTFAALAAGRYYLITQAYEKAGQGPLGVTLSTPAKAEICNNGVDDNGNGLIDCADAQCAADPDCAAQACAPDFNLGALVVNGAPKAVSFETAPADADNDVSCAAAPGGHDVVVRFTLHETAGLLLRWDQTGDHVVALLRSPQPGLPCDADPLDCYDPSGRAQDQVAWTDRPPGDYELIFKALRPGAEGHIDAQLSAYRPRRVELCHNGIDDDGNGLVDCADPACKGVAGCDGPFCMPDAQLGDMSVGEARAVTLDVAGHGVPGYDVSCARGGGKGMVVQLSVPRGGAGGGFGLGVDCAQTGDHVIELFAAGGPRDACDVNPITCADPKTLPFGCGYEMPNLQPGTYNVIVEAFEPGTAGTVDLTLTIDDDRRLEICNNGVDDDGDGFVDCDDRKCAASPACAQTQCRADATIDPMPLDGSPVDEVVQTSGAAAQARPSCETTSGGPTAVVALRLTAKADLALAWNQFGDHDFALYDVVGSMLPCDAGTLLQCTKSSGQNGSATWRALPAGRYWLVVAADAPTSAGSAALRLTGSPSP